jgi:hypothetical protein
MKTSAVQYILLALWLFGLLACASMALLALPKIEPDSGIFAKLLNNVLDTFMPQIAAMLAFIFADHVAGKKARPAPKGISILAVILSAIYVVFFSSLMILFGLNFIDLPASDVNALFELIRPKGTFLVTASLAYFFASRKSSRG